MNILQSNVKIVSGALKYCIYNLNNGKLYSLDRIDVDNILFYLKNQYLPKNVEQDFLNYLIKEQLIVDEKNALPQLELEYKEYFYAPEFAWIEVTQNCNLICRHCYEESSRNDCRLDMTISDFRFAVDFLVEHGIKRMQLVGGEPLMHPKILEMIDYIKGKFDYIEIFTNATLLTDDILQIIKDNNIRLAVSIYSNNAVVHDYVTQTEGTFAQTMKRINQAISMGIAVRIASVEMKNVPRFKLDNLDIMQKTDLPRVTGRANLSLYTKDMLHRKLITSKNFEMPIEAEDFYKNHYVHNCFGNRLYISSDLNMYPCAMERRISYGNIKELDAFEKAASNFLTTLTKDEVDGCKDCEYRYACYDCRSDSCGRPIKSKPWNCSYDPYTGTWMPENSFDELLSELC